MFTPPPRNSGRVRHVDKISQCTHISLDVRTNNISPLPHTSRYVLLITRYQPMLQVSSSRSLRETVSLSFPRHEKMPATALIELR